MVMSSIQNVSSIHGLGIIRGLDSIQNVSSIHGLGIATDEEVSEHGCSQYFNRHQKMALK